MSLPWVSGNQIEAGGKTDRGAWSLSGRDQEAVGGQHFCGFERHKEKGRS
jgi:hypothetical protein